MSNITAQQCRALLHYEPATGIFWWRNTNSNRAVAGTRAGSEGADGYITIMVDDCNYAAARLAFLWMTGSLPDQLVDHVDGDRANNRWSNLRQADYALIAENRKQSNSLGLQGVSRNGSGYAARIIRRGRRYCLGTYDTPQEAHAAWRGACLALRGELPHHLRDTASATAQSAPP